MNREEIRAYDRARSAKYYREHKAERLAVSAQNHLENRDRYNRLSRARYHRNWELRQRQRKAWKLAHPEHNQWGNQRQNAKRRGIVFLFTLEAWIEWWGDDLPLRGRAPDALCMGRFGDEGAYELGNVYKCSNSENRSAPRPLPEPGF